MERDLIQDIDSILETGITKVLTLVTEDELETHGVATSCVHWKKQDYSYSMPQLRIKEYPQWTN